jgi:hypothetical protein
MENVLNFDPQRQAYLLGDEEVLAVPAAFPNMLGRRLVPIRETPGLVPLGCVRMTDGPDPTPNHSDICLVSDWAAIRAAVHYVTGIDTTCVPGGKLLVVSPPANILAMILMAVPAEQVVVLTQPHETGEDVNCALRFVHFLTNEEARPTFERGFLGQFSLPKAQVAAVFMCDIYGHTFTATHKLVKELTRHATVFFSGWFYEKLEGEEMVALGEYSMEPQGKNAVRLVDPWGAYDVCGVADPQLLSGVDVLHHDGKRVAFMSSAKLHKHERAVPIAALTLQRGAEGFVHAVTAEMYRGAREGHALADVMD